MLCAYKCIREHVTDFQSCVVHVVHIWRWSQITDRMLFSSFSVHVNVLNNTAIRSYEYSLNLMKILRKCQRSSERFQNYRTTLSSTDFAFEKKWLDFTSTYCVTYWANISLCENTRLPSNVEIVFKIKVLQKSRRVCHTVTSSRDNTERGYRFFDRG